MLDYTCIDEPKQEEYQKQVVSITVHNYEWVCPHCGELNVIPELPLHNKIVCKICTRISWQGHFAHAYEE